MELDFAIFSRMARSIYPSLDCSYSVKDVLFVFKCFFDEFERRTGKPHPPISRANTTRIIERMSALEDGNPIEPVQYIDLIDSYFNTDFPACDYHISHFFSGRIRDNRWYEAFYG